MPLKPGEISTKMLVIHSRGAQALEHETSVPPRGWTGFTVQVGTTNGPVVLAEWAGYSELQPVDVWSTAVVVNGEYSRFAPDDYVMQMAHDWLVKHDHAASAQEEVPR